MRQGMSKVVLAAVVCGLASCKSPPVAEWVVFEVTPEATIYVDAASIQQEGDRAEMWALIDYKEPQPDKTGKRVLSDKLRYRYDCKAKQFSITATSAHAGPMASGETINVNPDPPQVAPVPPGTTAERMWERACAVGVVEK
jgi:hypothetical protein